MNRKRLAGLLLMATAMGVNAANFSPLVTGVPTGLIYGVHFILLIPLIWGALLLGDRPVAGVRMVTVAVLTMMAGDLFMIGFALANPNPAALGPHNFNDYSPVVLFGSGALLWFAGGRRRERRSAAPASRQTV